MTKAEKDMILSLRQQKYSFYAIAQATGISVGTIKSFLSRTSGKKKPVAIEQIEKTAAPDTCKHCGVPLIQPAHKRRKTFCSERCRMLYWNEHRDLSQRASAHCQICAVCGKAFFTYRGQYCSRTCAGKSRSQKAGVVHG